MIGNLKSVIAELRTFYFPKNYKTIRRPLEKWEIDHTASFLIRCHGEIESAIENECRRIADDLEADLVKGRWTRTAAAMIFYYGGNGTIHSELKGCFEVKNGAKKLKEQIDPDSALVDALRKYRKAVKDNNGIKEHNILGLLMPLGVPCASLDQIGLKNLNELGKGRGVLAHNDSASWQMKSISVHPTVVDKKVIDALAEVRALSAVLRSLP